jgi:hypothetical protein
MEIADQLIFINIVVIAAASLIPVWSTDGAKLSVEQRRT